MKTLYKLTAVLAILPLMTTSCVEDLHEQYAPDKCQNVYFQSLPVQDIELEPTDRKELTFKVYRPIKDNPEELTAVTVPVELEASRLESGEKAFKASAIVFEEGQVETEFTVSFPEAKIGQTYDCSIAITDPEFVSIYSKDQTRLNFNVTRVQWVPVVGEDGEKTGVFCDDLLCETLNGLKPFYKKPVEIQTRADRKGIYRIRNLYDDEYLGRMLGVPAEAVPQFGVTVKPSAIVIDATDPKKVIWKKTSTGLDMDGYGQIYFFSIIPEYVKELPANEARYGTLSDGVIRFPPKAIAFEIGSLSAPVNEAGKTKIVLPGYKDTDYTLEVKAGMSDAEGKLPVEITRGKDIKTIKYTVVQGKLPPLGIVKSANKIGDGTLKAETLPAGAKKFDVTMENSGVYTVVLAGFDSEDKYVANAGSQISYVAKGDERPVKLNCGIIVSNKHEAEGNTSENSLEIYISGENLTKVHYGLYPKDLYKSMPEDITKALKKVPALPEKSLDQANTTVWSGVINELEPGTEYILLVNATNGYSEKLMKIEASTEGEYNPFQATYFPASLISENITKKDFLDRTMYLYQYDEKAKKRVNLGKVKMTDGGQMEAEGKQVELVNIEGIWTAAVSKEDEHFKIEKDITKFVFMDGFLFNWKSEYGKVTAELVNPDDGSTFIHTAEGAMTSIFQYQTVGTIPLSYTGGFTKEDNIAFMDSGEFEKDEGACLAIGLGLYTDKRYDDLSAVVSVLTNFILVAEDNIADEPAAGKNGMPETLLQRTSLRNTGKGTRTILTGWSARQIRTAGRLSEITPEYEAVPASFIASVEF